MDQLRNSKMRTWQNKPCECQNVQEQCHICMIKMLINHTCMMAISI
jgi:hypothetical protein